jgi:HTH-type transcriptional regulator/antitoxin MqsA
MLDFNKQVNASIVDPAFIARVRKKLALDQRHAAAIFGGGPNAFSRYENGKTKPPLALVKLFMLLDRHPKLLNEVHPGRQPGTAGASEPESRAVSGKPPRSAPRL